MLQTALGTKSNWYRRHSYNNDKKKLLKPAQCHRNVLHDLENSF